MKIPCVIDKILLLKAEPRSNEEVECIWSRQGACSYFDAFDFEAS